MNIYSWNVNGLRAVHNKGELNNFFENYNPDILCIQETKAQKEQLDNDILNIGSYKSYMMSAKKKGYSGVLVYTKVEPNEVLDLGIEEFDNEGRYIELVFDNFHLINCYFPNSQAKGARLDYKLKFNKAIKKRIDILTKNDIKVILCGDLNVAHQEIDLKNPKANTKNPGFLPEEREWIDEVLNDNLIDTFRFIHDDKIKYSWWSYRFNARANNAGWRIDYFLINNHMQNYLRDADILNEVYGSDHCPVYIKIKTRT